MANSSITLRQIVDDAATIADLAPALATGGYSDQPALSIANDVMTAMLGGSPEGSPFNWKWNRFNVTPFCTISWQQDYFVPGLVNLSWIEYSWAADINSTSNPKPKMDLESKRDLEVTYMQTGYPGKICWIPNDQCITGTWGQSPLGPTSTTPQGQSGVVGTGLSGNFNPGPNVIYTNPLGAANSAPVNALTCIKDPNGNLWALTTYGTCGATQPVWPSSPSYPTQKNPTIVATTVADGTCVWTAINPKGQGFRINPIPPQTGRVWQIQVVGQMRIPYFTSMSQTLEPVPDDYVSYFKQGFFAQCYRRSPDPKVRAKFSDEWSMWLRALDMAVKQGQREMDDMGFYPTTAGVMDTGWSAMNYPSPAQPYGPW